MAIVGSGKRRWTVVLVTLALLVGFAAGWFLSPGRLRYLLEARTPVAITDKQGTLVATLPAGTPMVAASRPRPGDEIGWWACVPIALGTGDEASALVTSTPESVSRVPWVMTLNGLNPSKVKPAASTETPK